MLNERKTNKVLLISRYKIFVFIDVQIYVKTVKLFIAYDFIR